MKSTGEPAVYTVEAAPLECLESIHALLLSPECDLPPDHTVRWNGLPGEKHDTITVTRPRKTLLTRWFPFGALLLLALTVLTGGVFGGIWLIWHVATVDPTGRAVFGIRARPADSRASRTELTIEAYRGAPDVLVQVISRHIERGGIITGAPQTTYI